jgi:hypothetical protein
MAGTSQAVWPPGHSLYANEPMGEKRVLDRVSEQLQLEQIMRLRIEAFSLDSTSVKVHPDGTGGGWNTTIHMVAADSRTAIAFSLSAGNDHDAPHGRALLEELGPMPVSLPLLMERAYEGNQTRQLVLALGMTPVVPP